MQNAKCIYLLLTNSSFKFKIQITSLYGCCNYTYCHKVLIYIEHHSVCPLVGIGTPPTPLPQARVPSPPPPPQRVGGHNRLRLRGWGSSNSDDWRKCSALCLLSAYYIFGVIRVRWLTTPLTK
jgi:hypothetical protein